MVLEKGVDLRSGVIAEQAPQLSRRELIFAVGFQGDGFECCAFEVLAGGGKKYRELLGQVQHQLRHKSSIKESGADCTERDVIAYERPLRACGREVPHLFLSTGRPAKADLC